MSVTVPDPVPPDVVQVAEASLMRCAGVPFFQAFYDRLLAASDEFPPKFAHTDFERQHRLVQHGLGLLFSFAKRPNPALLERIALRHGRGDLDVRPDQHHHFADALLATVREFDAKCDAAVEEAWRRALAPGLAYMTSRYDASAPKAG